MCLGHLYGVCVTTIIWATRPKQESIRCIAGLKAIHFDINVAIPLVSLICAKYFVTHLSQASHFHSVIPYDCIVEIEL